MNKSIKIIDNKLSQQAKSTNTSKDKEKLDNSKYFLLHNDITKVIACSVKDYEKKAKELGKKPYYNINLESSFNINRKGKKWFLKVKESLLIYMKKIKQY